MAALSAMTWRLSRVIHVPEGQREQWTCSAWQKLAWRCSHYFLFIKVLYQQPLRVSLATQHSRRKNLFRCIRLLLGAFQHGLNDSSAFLLPWSLWRTMRKPDPDLEWKFSKVNLQHSKAKHSLSGPGRGSPELNIYLQPVASVSQIREPRSTEQFRCLT